MNVLLTLGLFCAITYHASAFINPGQMSLPSVRSPVARPPAPPAQIAQVPQQPQQAPAQTAQRQQASRPVPGQAVQRNQGMSFTDALLLGDKFQDYFKMRTLSNAFAGGRGGSPFNPAMGLASGMEYQDIMAMNALNNRDPLAGMSGGNGRISPEMLYWMSQ